MKLLKYIAIGLPILLSACTSNANTENTANKAKEKHENSSEANIATPKKQEKVTVSICEPDYQPLNYCTPKFQKLFQEESQKSANFDKNKRVIVTKVQMKQNPKGIYEHYLVVLDLDNKKAYPLGQVVTSFSEEKGYLISQQPKIEYGLNSDTICFSGTLIGYQDSHENVENACYEFKEQYKDILPINEPFTERKIATAPITTSSANKISNLPFTQKNIDTQDKAQIQIHELSPLPNETIEKQAEKFMGGSSDAGYCQLPNVGNVQVFVGYGLFEDDDPKKATKDNPDGAYVAQENYLVTINGEKLNYISLGDKFSIDKSYKNIIISSNGKTTVYYITDDGKIVKN